MEKARSEHQGIRLLGYQEGFGIYNFRFYLSFISLCLSGFVAINLFEKTKPICVLPPGKPRSQSFLEYTLYSRRSLRTLRLSCKQSQSAPGIIILSNYILRGYVNLTAGWSDENKPNSKPFPAITFRTYPEPAERGRFMIYENGFAD